MQIGDTIRKYKIEALVGEGGMGVVWKARDSELGRAVAIKMIHQRYALEPDIRKRFIDEARIQAALVHQNICTLFDAFDEGGHLYLVQEYVDGLTVKQMLEQCGGPLPIDQTLEIARGVLAGLAHAHEEGVIHRDIKPSNIIVNQKGRAKIMDFGIAKALGAERMGKTKTGMTVGTPEYMSPEQILGKEVDARSDLYSFGMTLYEMLTGKLPFEHTSSEYEIQRFHVEGAVPTVRGRNQAVPAWLDEMLQKCLAKKASERYNSATQVDLTPSPNDIVVPPKPDLPKPEKLPQKPQSSCMLSGCFIALILVAGLVGVAYFTYFINHQARERAAEERAAEARAAEQRSAESRVSQLRAPQAAIPKTPAISLGAGVTMEMVPVPPGSYLMGSPEAEAGRDNDETPRHQVTISRPFYIGKYEVTQAQWVCVMGSNPSWFKGEDLPVENVSWNDCLEFCRKLTERERAAGRLPAGVVYRLPTEAEWEYACRAGTTTRYYTGDSESDLARAGWFDGNSGDRTHPVGQKVANAFGLYDMHGNVWEWCQDWYGSYITDDATDPGGPQRGSLRVLRGGSWSNNASYCPAFADSSLGFRLVLPAGQ
jgi:formylglycine-generating enzyme required for sulfatase activity